MQVTETSAERPTAEAIGALLPRFTGQITQVPPNSTTGMPSPATL